MYAVSKQCTIHAVAKNSKRNERTSRLTFICSFIPSCTSSAIAYKNKSSFLEDVLFMAILVFNMYILLKCNLIIMHFVEHQRCAPLVKSIQVKRCAILLLHGCNCMGNITCTISWTLSWFCITDVNGPIRGSHHQKPKLLDERRGTPLYGRSRPSSWKGQSRTGTCQSHPAYTKNNSKAWAWQRIWNSNLQSSYMRNLDPTRLPVQACPQQKWWCYCNSLHQNPVLQTLRNGAFDALQHGDHGQQLRMIRRKNELAYVRSLPSNIWSRAENV